MKRLKAIGILLAGSLCGANPATAQQIPLGQETHGAWTVSCSRDRLTDRVDCTMLAMARARAQQPRLGIIVYAGAEGEPEVLIFAQRYAPTGGAFRIGALEAEELKGCQQARCEPWPGRGAVLVEQMKAQPGTVYVRLNGPGAAPLEGDVSLNGFKAAAAAWENARRRLR